MLSLLFISPHRSLQEVAMAGRMPIDNQDLPDCCTTSSSDSEMEPANAMNAEGAAASGMATESPAKTVPGDTVEGAIDRLLERNRSEIMFELRRLKMGERPVTGQGNKEAVEDFFQRQINSAEGGPSSEEHRPEAVMVEVQGLVERAPVSSILQSQGFRRRLENALRTSIAGRMEVSANHLRNAGSRLRNTAASAPAPTRNVSAQASASQAPPPAPPLRPEVISAISQGYPAPVMIPPRAPALPVAPQERVARAANWLDQHIVEPVPQDPEVHQLQAVQENLHDQIIEEISELVQQQLVTQSLDSQFRGTLERMVAHRVNNSGTDGHRVQEYIRSIPRVGMHIRNDFSELGIGGAQAWNQALSDEVSVISATAAVHVQQAQVSRAVSLELSSLRAQVAELKNMMKLSFDLQLDVQRAIRQEVAAAVSGALAGATAAPLPRCRPADDSQCLICLDAATDSVLYQCGHMCVCYTCGLRLKQQQAHCPMCRAPIRDIIRAYKCNSE